MTMKVCEYCSSFARRRRKSLTAGVRQHALLPVPPGYQVAFLLLVTAGGGFGALVAYLLQNDRVALTGAAGAGLAAILGILQWLIGQERETSRTTWEAVKTLYSEGDTQAIYKARTQIFAGNFSNAHVLCNLYEKWGRLVHLGYLPIRAFEGSNGVSISNTAIALTNFIAERRQQNERYAHFYLQLVSKVHACGYLAGTRAQEQVPEMLARLVATEDTAP